MSKKIMSFLLIVTMFLGNMDTGVLVAASQDVVVDGIILDEENEKEELDENSELSETESEILQEEGGTGETDISEEGSSIEEIEESSDAENQEEGFDEEENVTESNADFSEEISTEDMTNVIDETESEFSPSNDNVGGYSIADSYAGGSGTSNDPFLIANAEQLFLCAQELSNGDNTSGSAYPHYYYYKLCNDIYLNNNMENPQNIWTPVAAMLPFSLDGDYHTIYNLYIKSEASEIGMFVYNQNTISKPSISNLTIENAKIECESEAESKVGVLVGGDSFFETVSICNIRGDISISSSSSLYVGGIVYGARSIQDCTMEGNLTMHSDKNVYFGGVVYSGGNIINCKNIGNIIVKGFSYGGGIVYNTSNLGNVSDCQNIGNIMTNRGAVGGIAYSIYGTMESCSNQKEASVISETGDAAGIAIQGYASTIEGCANYGIVSGGSNANGIVYSFWPYINGSGSVLDCNNEGIVEGKYISGIIGKIKYGIVRGCVNRRDLTGEGSVAGIIGTIENLSNNSSVIISDCVNEADLKGNNVGGIVKEVNVSVDSDGTQIIDCYNEGNLIGEFSVGGIINNLGSLPLSYKGVTTVKNCHNLGEIECNGKAGGIVGDLEYGIIENCYNAGKISSRNYSGGIASEMGLYGDKESLQIKNCYNLGEIIVGNNAGIEGSAGGIVSNMNVGTLSKCYNMGRITNNTTGYGYTGGIVGDVFAYQSDYDFSVDGTIIITNCFNCGNIVSSINFTGGIVGRVFGTREDYSLYLAYCYNVGKIELNNASESAESAGIGIMTLRDNEKIHSANNYYLEDEFREPSISTTAIPATSCSESQMTQISTYQNWDFSETWKMGRRKYVFPILRGVGENYLTYNYGGIGQDTVFGEYILQVVDKNSGSGVSKAVISYQNQTPTADLNGMIRILSAETDLGTVSVAANHYEDWAGQIILQSGKVNTIELEPKREINFSNISARGNVRMETGKTTIEKDSSNAVDVDLPIKLDLKFKATEDKEEGSGGSSVSDSIPIKITWEGDTKAKISIGSESKNQDEYQYAKNLFGKWAGLPSDKVLKEMGKSDIKSISGKLGSKSVKIYVLGYITIDFSSGSPKVIESAAVAGIEGEGSITYRPAWAGTVAYGQLKLNVGVEGKLKVSFDELLGYFDFSGELQSQFKLTVAVGIGYDFAKGEVGAEGSLTGKMNIKKNWDIKDDLEIKLQAVPYALLKIGFFNIKTDLDGWEWRWPGNNTRDNIESKEFAGPLCLLSERDYLESRVHDTKLSTAYSTNKGANITSLNLDDVYPEGEPQICTMSDGTRVAVWVADDGSKDSADRTTLYYAVVKDGILTSCGSVHETGRSDYSPRLLSKGDSVYLAWMNADKIYGNSVDFKEYYSNISLYLSVFDGMSFGKPIKVTETGNHLPIMADLCADGNGVMVTWAENSEDDPFFSKGNNTIYSRYYAVGELGEKKVLVKDIPYIYSMDCGYVNGVYTVAWSQDTDGNLATGADAEVFLYSRGNVEQFTDNTLEDINVQFLGNDLYWCSDSIIKRMPELDNARSENLGIVCENTYRILQGGLGIAIVWLEKDGFTTMPVVSYEKGGVFTNPIPLGDFGHVNISGYDAVYEDDGSITLFYDEKEVYEEWSETPYGQTNMRYITDLTPSDLLVDDYLYYDTMIAKPGETLTFQTDVTNHTVSQIDVLHMTLKAGETILKEEDCAVGLSVGEKKKVTVDYVLPQNFAIGTYTLIVTASNVEENDLSNNHASASVGYGNLAFKDCSIEEKDGSIKISGKIINDGCQPIYDKAIYVRVNGQDGEIIGQIDSVALEVNESQEFTFTVDERYVDFTYAYDVLYFYLSIEGEESESNYADNSEILLFQPILATSVDLEDDFQMTLGSSKELSAIIMPQNAYSDCLFTSSDLSIASVDTKGVITAYGIGQTVITAVTRDGQAVDSCTVTVVAGDYEDTVEYSMSDTKVSMAVEEELFLQIFAQAEEGTKIEPVTVIWKSSDENVVSVEEKTIEFGENEDGEYLISEGRIQALQEGNAVITGIVGNDTVVFCLVTVTDNAAKAVTLEKAVYEMNKGEALQLVWKSIPAEIKASDFIFTSSDETVATVDSDGRVLALSQGSSRIEMSYIVTDNEPKEVKAACMIEVTDPELTVYELRFNINGGSILSESVAYQSGTRGYTFIFPEPPTRPGYIFLGWNDKEDGTGISYDGSETLTAGVNVLENLNLYAVWMQEINGLWAASVPDQVYTGKKIMPKVAVYDGTVLLTEGTDYTLSYKNNIKVADASDGKNAPVITVKGKGNYSGSQKINFTILPRDIGNSEGIAASDIWKKANGKLQKAIPVVTWNGKKLVNKKDFILEYSDEGNSPDAYKIAGVYSIRIVGIGNYTGERNVSLTLTDGNLISKVSVAKVKNQPYTGEAIEPELIVKYGRTLLHDEMDYTVRYENNTEIGKATAIIIGKGSYAGEKRVTFTITGGTIKNAKVTGIPKSLVYMGEDLTIHSSSWGMPPVLSLTVNKETKILKEGIDYTISYQKNSKVGTASIIFTGINGYSGILKKTFKITAYDITQDIEKKIRAFLYNNSEIPYAKGGSKPKPTVSFEDIVLTEGKDYTLSYKNNKVISDGTQPKKVPTVIIKGKGNFKGTMELTYTIVQQDLKELSITLPDKVYQEKNNAYKSIPKIKDLDGKPLTAGKDYEKNIVYTYKESVTLENGKNRKTGDVIEADDVLPVGTVVQVQVIGKGSYKGKLLGEYRIVQKNINNAKVTIPAQEYTGKAIKPGKGELQVKLGKITLQERDYEIVGYSNNINKGKATITIKGVGNYGGSKSVKFKIKAKGFLWWQYLFSVN